MNAVLAVSRSEQTEAVATHLLPRASLITRLMLAGRSDALTRAEAGLLSALDDGPQRVTALARSQVLAQPTVTQLVARLEARGLVSRQKDAADGRVVLVARTTAGDEVLSDFREDYRRVLRGHLEDRSDADVAALAAAVELLGEVIEGLQA